MSKGQILLLQRREKTQPRPEMWPFLYSVVPGRRGLIRNVAVVVRVRKPVKQPVLG